MDAITPTDLEQDETSPPPDDPNQEKARKYLNKTWGAKVGGGNTGGDAKPPRKQKVVMGMTDDKLAANFAAWLRSTRAAVESLKRAVLKGPDAPTFQKPLTELESLVSQAVAAANQGSLSDGLDLLKQADTAMEADRWRPVRTKGEVNDFKNKCKICMDMLQRLRETGTDKDVLNSLREQLQGALAQRQSAGTDPGLTSQANATLDVVSSKAGKLRDLEIHGEKFGIESGLFNTDLAALKGNRQYTKEYRAMSIQAFQAGEKAKTDPGAALGLLRELRDQLKSIQKKISLAEEKKASGKSNHATEAEFDLEAILEFANRLEELTPADPRIGQLRQECAAGQKLLGDGKDQDALGKLQPIFNTVKPELDRLKVQVALYQRKLAEVAALEDPLQSTGDNVLVRLELRNADAEKQSGNFDKAMKILDQALKTYGPSGAKARTRQKFEGDLKTATGAKGLPADLEAKRAKAQQMLEALEKLSKDDSQWGQARLEARKQINPVLAYVEKVAKQDADYKAMTGDLKGVKASYFKEGTGDYNREMIEENLFQNPSDEEKARAKEYVKVMQALSLVEKAVAPIRKDDFTNAKAALQALDVYEKAAADYLAYCDKNKPSAAVLNDAKAMAVFDNRVKGCKDAQKQVLHYRLLIRLGQVGKPPWDDVAAGKVGELRAKVVLEQGYLDGEIETGGASTGSYWLNNAKLIDQGGETQVKAQKQMLFKTQAAEKDFMGFKKGDNAPREVLGKAVGDTLKSMTGLDFGIPDTHLIRVDAKRLPEMDANSVAAEGKDGEMLGSAQQFARSRGELKQMIHGETDKRKKNPGNKAFAATIDPKTTQKVAILDIVQLHVDRHDGNFMVGEPDADGNFDLTPIDQGRALPDRNGLTNARVKMGFQHNCVGLMPGAFEPFDDEMKECIELIDPDQLAKALQDKLTALNAQHPELKGDAKSNAEAILASKRSAEFLKYAAKKGLSINAVYNALAVEGADLLLCNDGEKAQKFATAATAAGDRVASMKSLGFGYNEAANDELLKKYLTELKALGWCSDQEFFGAMRLEAYVWLQRNAKDADRLIRGKIENPALRQEIDSGLQSLDYPIDLMAKLAALDTPGQLTEVQKALAVRANGGKDPNEELEKLAKKHGFENTSMPQVLALMARVKKERGKVNNKKAGEKMDDHNRLDAVVIDLSGGEEAAEAILNECAKDFPDTAKAIKKGKGKIAEFLPAYQKFKQQLPSSGLTLADVQKAIDPLTPSVGLHYLQYRQLGGEQEYLKQGGNAEEPLSRRVPFLRARKAEKAMGTAAGGSDAAAKKLVSTALNRLDDLITRIENKKQKIAIEQKYLVIRTWLGHATPDQILPELARLEQEIKSLK